MLQCKYNKLGGKVQNECGHTTYIISAVTRLILTQGLSKVHWFGLDAELK